MKSCMQSLVTIESQTKPNNSEELQIMPSNSEEQQMKAQLGKKLIMSNMKTIFIRFRIANRLSSHGQLRLGGRKQFLIGPVFVLSWEIVTTVLLKGNVPLTRNFSSSKMTTR